MESHTRQELKVGIFVAVGVVALAFSIIIFGGDQLFFTRTFVLKAVLKDVQGLGPGSVVSLSGLPVGNVREINFEPASASLQVIMDVETRHQSRITDTAVASVKTQGALGDRYIYVDPGSMQGEVLKDGAMLRTSEKGDLFDVISQKGSELSVVVDIVKEIHQLMKNINQNNRSAILMENLVSASDNMSKLGRDGQKTMQRLESILAKIDKGEGSLGALINDPTLHNRLLSMVGEAPRNKYLKPLIRQSIQASEKK